MCVCVVLARRRQAANAELVRDLRARSDEAGTFKERTAFELSRADRLERERDELALRITDMTKKYFNQVKRTKSSILCFMVWLI